MKARLTLLLLLLPLLPSPAVRAHCGGGVTWPRPVPRPESRAVPGTGAAALPGPATGAAELAARDADEWLLFWILNRRALAGLAPERAGDVDPELRAEALEALLAAADEEDVELASTALVALGRLRERPLIPRLAVAAADRERSASEREAATISLGLLGGEYSVAALAVLAESTEHPEQRGLALLGMGLTRHLRAVHLLAPRFGAEPESVAECALLGAGLVPGAPIAPELEALAGTPGPRADLALGAGAKLGLRDLLPAARTRLRREGGAAAVLAIGALARVGDEEAIRDLGLVAAGWPDPRTRGLACVALARTGDGGHVAAIANALAAGELPTASRAALAAGLLARTTRSRDARELLAGALRARLDPSGAPSLVAAAALGLGLAGLPGDPAGVERLLDPDRPDLVRVEAAVALALNARDGGLATARDLLLLAPSMQHRREAAFALRLLDDRTAAAGLLGVLDGAPATGRRGSAALALGLLGDRAAVPLLLATLRDADAPPALRALAAGALGRILDPRDADPAATLAAELDPTLLNPWIREVISFF